MPSVVALAAFLLVIVTKEVHGADTHTDELHDFNYNGCLNDKTNEKTTQLHHILPKLMFAQVSPNNALASVNPANYKWICHTDDTHAGNVQYITLYNIQDNLPVYSAYKASPAFKGFGTPGPAFKRPPWKDPKPSAINNLVLPNDADYKLGPASLIDRGHLFAAAYASADEVQFKSTFKMTNVVAQDFIFNRKVWSQAERILKAVGMKTCLHNGVQPGIPLVVTGAVPENLNADPYYQPYFSVQPIDGNRMPFKVPVIMWTTMWCMINNKFEFHVSFIGDNGPRGDVMFYRDFNVFQKELTGMYGFGNIGDPWQGMTTPPTNDGINNLLDPEIQNQDELRWANNAQVKWTSGFRSMRINFLEDLLQANLLQMNIHVHSSDIAAVRVNQNRKRRSNSQTAVQTNTTFTLVEILDQDPDSDFKLTECSVVEEIKQTGKRQTHTIDMDKNKLIESSDPTGSKLTGSFQGEDGKVKEMNKEKSKEKTISIVLSPRTP